HGRPYGGRGPAPHLCGGARHGQFGAGDHALAGRRLPEPCAVPLPVPPPGRPRGRVPAGGRHGHRRRVQPRPGGRGHRGRPVPHEPVAVRPGAARRGPPAGRPRLPTATAPVLVPLGDPRRAGHHVPTTPRRHRVATTPQLHRGRPADG